jgi:hypothetical protein
MIPLWSHIRFFGFSENSKSRMIYFPKVNPFILKKAMAMERMSGRAITRYSIEFNS